MKGIEHIPQLQLTSFQQQANVCAYTGTIGCKNNHHLFNKTYEI